MATTANYTPPKPAVNLLPAIDALLLDILQEVGRGDSTPLQDYFTMIESSPLVGPALEAKILLALNELGEYENDDPKLTEWVRKNFEQMNGSLELSVAEMLSCLPLGYSFSPFGVKQNNGEWWLDTLMTADPRKYLFRGQKGNIVDVRYLATTGDIIIPYKQGVHLVNGRHMAFRNPYGQAEMKRVTKLHAAWLIVVGEVTIAAKHTGTPILVGYADPEESVPLVNDDGSPKIGPDGQQLLMEAAKVLLGQMLELESSGVLATSIKNKIESLPQETSGSFFFEALRYLSQMILFSFLIPETLLSTAGNGTGDSNLNEGHRLILEQHLRSIMSQVKEGLIESLVRPLIFWNFGEQEDYGRFVKPEAVETTESRVLLLNALSSAINAGAFSAADLNVINRMYELSGLPPVKELFRPELDKMLTDLPDESAGDQPDDNRDDTTDQADDTEADDNAED